MNPQLSKTQLPAKNRPGKNEAGTHLSDEVINDLLIGDPSIGIGAQEVEAHLAACEHCRERIAAFRANLDLFNQSSLAWAESKSNPEAATEALSVAAIEADRARRQAQQKPRLLTWRPLTAATAALLLAAGLLWNHQHPNGISGQTGPTQIAAPEFADNPDQIAEDNQLLDNVYNALDEKPQIPEEFSVVGTDNPSRTSTKARTQ